MARGKTLFVSDCAGRHGPQGKGDGYRLLGPDPANLTAPSTTKKSDADLFKTIHDGKPNMPAWKVHLSEAQSRDVLGLCAGTRQVKPRDCMTACRGKLAGSS